MQNAIFIIPTHTQNTQIPIVIEINEQQDRMQAKERNRAYKHRNPIHEHFVRHSCRSNTFRYCKIFYYQLLMRDFR